MADMLRRSLIDRTTEKEITQRVVSFFCVHFTPQSRLRLDGRSVSGLLLFMSTPHPTRFLQIIRILHGLFIRRQVIRAGVAALHVRRDGFGAGFGEGRNGLGCRVG